MRAANTHNRGQKRARRPREISSGGQFQPTMLDSIGRTSSSWSAELPTDTSSASLTDAERVPLALLLALPKSPWAPTGMPLWGPARVPLSLLPPLQQRQGGLN